MKLRVDRDALADAVAWTAKSLPVRPSVPVLAGALLTVEDGRLTISGFDYEVSSQVTLDVSADSSGSALVSGKLLAEIVKALPAKPVDLAAEGSHVELTCGSARFTLPTMPVEDYPALPDMPSSAGTVDAAAFAAAVAQTAVAAGRDDTLPTMTGVQLEFNGSGLALMATDRYRMAIRDLDWRPENGDINVTTLIPAKALSDTAKALGSRGGEVTIALPDSESGGVGMVGFAADGRRTTSRVLDGQLPPLRSLIPSSFSSELRVNTAEIGAVARRVSLVAERNSQLRLSFDDDGLVVEAGGAEDAKASEGLDCQYTGEATKVAFNPQYLLDGLSAVSAPVAVFSFAGSGKPVTLTGDKMSEDDEGDYSGYRHLLQPLRYDG
ncbi:MAG TPA: DNA polymerase III subunit beta [Stackebrandtia sp.]|jgi:DNA polymerase-3 subunit beta|uniref:DNA polymerase III subunit beta n=1 Tax=Stackebrandtia sp. TaxID=2023065 RepID=UPI002D66E69C|nr:DNA polymerase III subunit beta [Stackebrandtia sp.]HZE40834.1 DNA polymerase III subunit beta [Stackebrandtia sp.]